MKSLVHLVSLASAVSAHTLFTTLFVDGENQGDGTCIRMPKDGETATAPIYPLTGDDMACGRDGGSAVPFVCPAPGGSTLTFQFRVWPNAEQPGAIDGGHKGPCSVYIKKVDDMFSDSASGPGWFKIWEDGYDADSGKWCVDTLIDNEGLLSVNLPTGLPSGYYLVRPELIALHQAYRGDPQFYHSCAQVFIPDGPEGTHDIPEEYEVSIPGYVEADAPGLTFNLYEDEPSTYQIPGPKVYVPESSSASAAGSAKEQRDGKIPDSCLLKNGNWCAKAVPRSSDQESCWDSVDNCWAQSEECWDTAPVTGGAGCEVWSDYCETLSTDCEGGNYEGPAAFEGEEQFADVPGDIPVPYNTVEGTKVEEGDKPATTTKPAKPAKTASATAEPAPQETAGTSPDEEAVESEDGAELKVSEDGRCGAETGQTCKGSSFGECCSKKGKCGRKTRHCACGCQSGFGQCRE